MARPEQRGLAQEVGAFESEGLRGGTMGKKVVPGSAEAEAIADALLVGARKDGRRLARCLRQVAIMGRGESGGRLGRLAEEIALSCAYYTEKELRRRPGKTVQEGSSPLSFDEALTPYEPVMASPHWLSGVLADDPSILARRLGLSEAQCRIWALHVQGCTYEEIARVVGISRASVRTHLGRAHRKIAQSWLAVYRSTVR